MSGNYKPSREWFKQAEYDLDTAEAMLTAGRYIYTVFMSHLSIEKALKGLYTKKYKKDPPKTHDLSYLTAMLELELPDQHHEFLDDLNDLSVPTRYPNELEKLLKQYKKDKTSTLLIHTKELLQWLKKRD